MQVRVRFAPSPTGYLHVGGARTALYNWLFARKNQGKFILRIEDTDRTRYIENAVQDIIDSLTWLGLTWDEGPYYQSQRLEFYQKYAELLLKKGYAYRCYCSPERLENLRKEQEKLHLKPGYDRHCRNLKEEKSLPYVVRLKIDLEGETHFNDLLRGEIKVVNRELEDLILLKSDRLPTYHLANVVDDHLMGITHVLRADEWISSTHYHILLYQALGWEIPVFAHLPIILSPSGGKLSKREGASSVQELKAEGILPDALVNFLALLGWSPGEDREIVTREEMITSFELTRVGKRGASFDLNKLYWMNSEYIKVKDTNELVELLIPYGKNASLPEEKITTILPKVIPLLKPRVRVLKDLFLVGNYFFTHDFPYDAEGIKKYFRKGEIGDYLAQIKELLTHLEEEEFTTAKLEETVRNFANQLKIEPRELIHPLRLALTGKTVGPSLFELMEALGKTECISRIERVKQFFQG